MRASSAPGCELPGAVGLADRVPGPHGAGLDRLAVAQHAAHLAPLALDPAPAAVGDAGALRGQRIDVQVVVAVDLAQPGVLRIPRVVHRHRPLRDRVERIGGEVGRGLFERRVPERQRIEVGVDALAQMLGRLAPRASCPAPRGGSSAACRDRAPAAPSRSSGASPCPWRSRGTRGSSCACSACVSGMWYWKTQLFFAYISHCFGFGSPRRCSVPSLPRQPIRKPMPGCGWKLTTKSG